VPPSDATQDDQLKPTTLDAESCEWLCSLRAGGPEQDRATERLHQLLVKIAHSEANRRNSRMQLKGAELEDIAHQAAADALLAIVAKLERFRGESRFTTWAYKFVVFEGPVSITGGSSPVAQTSFSSRGRLTGRRLRADS
jgi:RNA polymerase sigma-70 factor, ECF subfamily